MVFENRFQIQSYRRWLHFYSRCILKSQFSHISKVFSPIMRKNKKNLHFFMVDFCEICFHTVCTNGFEQLKVQPAEYCLLGSVLALCG